MNEKCLLDCTPNEFSALKRDEILHGIRISGGKVLASMVNSNISPYPGDLTNAELSAASGAEILILDQFDAENPYIDGLPSVKQPMDTIRMVKKLTGRLIGIRLTAMDPQSHRKSKRLSRGMLATPQNAVKAAAMGANLLLIRGDHSEIKDALREVRKAVGDGMILFAGNDSEGNEFPTIDDINGYINNGADGVLLQGPGTMPGCTEEWCAERIAHIHYRGKLAIVSIGNGMENADSDTVKRIAFSAKLAGADLHLLGDEGAMGIADPEIFVAYSLAIRGRQETLRRMAVSLCR
ncbi:MAG: hypothetical protein ACI4WR_03095 [Bulleidia sp.]